MSKLDNIRKEVFEFLLEYHEQEKARGKEFYFMIEEVPIPYSSIPYIIPDENLAFDKDIRYFRVLFYGNWDQSRIAYLLISAEKKVYIIGEFKTEIDSDINLIVDKLNRFFVHPIYGLAKADELLSTQEGFFYRREIIDQKTVKDRIVYFLSIIKTGIDTIISPLKENTKYSYYFFNRQQFDDYLKNEPVYSQPQSIMKTNLALKRLRVQNFKGIKQLLLDELPPTARWIVLTGQNGYGKTSILQSIAAGLYGPYDETGAELVPISAFIGVEYYSSDQLVETNSRTLRLESEPKNLTNELATYGSSRLQVTATVSREMIEQQAPTTYHLFNSDGLLLNIEQYLKDTFSFDRPAFNRLVDLFKDLLPSLVNIDIIVNNRIPEVRYFEQDESGKLLTTGLLYSQLASGYKNIIAMVGDLVYRLSTRQDVDDISALEGIVIIDEMELHLHPKYQKRLPEILTKNFPKIQFIASTHSPIPLLGVPKDTVLLHVTRSEERGIEVERLDVDFSVLTPNAILSSPIFGFRDLIPDSKSDSDMVRSEDSYQAIEESDKMKVQISSFLTPDKQQELLRLLKQD